MADAVVELVLENLNSLLQKELGLFLGFNEDFKRLTSTLTAIKATLEDAEEKQFTDRAIKDWLQKLKDAAYVLDDILDECATETLEMENGGFMCGSSGKVQSSCLSSFHPKHVVFRRKIAEKMKSIRERLNEIAKERSNFHLTENVTPKIYDWRQTTSIITEPKVYGRDEDKDKIVDFLIGDASNFKDLTVYPILGLGGIGKTTLAQFIFNNERVVNHFEQRIWVCVSEDFSLKRMAKFIIESVTGHACADLNLDSLQRKLIHLLQGKRYLLVLDDVWDNEQENWQRLKSVLECGGKGASVLVTTRLQKVATVMGTIPPRELSILPDDDCLELFKQRAFRPNEVERAELVVIGKEIIKKCGGVPLAAKALGSFLYFKREEREWLYVKKSKLWSLQGENSVMSALRLSYLNLPIKLRQCFAFCALFHKDGKIRKQFLIELWMANGVISSNEMLDAEDVGDGLWNELYWRSFFRDIETDVFGKITYFKMPDLVHDLAQSVADEVYCGVVSNVITDVSERIRHLSFYGIMFPYDVNSIPPHRVKSLKTFLMGYYPFQFPREGLKCYSLRVLQCRGLQSMSISIGHLKYLRYLDISYGDFRALPESLCRLWNLQILKLDNCRYLEELPASLVCLKSLQHLSFKDCKLLCSLPSQMGKLTSLRTLSMYFVGKKKGFQLAELGGLNLKGELHIMHLERVQSVMDAKEANMSSKRLNHLQMSWGVNEESQSQENVEQIFEVLQPDTHQLQTLHVEGYRGACFPQWMSNPSLKYLNSVQLIKCKSCAYIPQLGKLPRLQYLRIYETSQVVYLYEESCDVGVFIALESLILEGMPNLIRLSREDGENMFPCLSKLAIIECPQLLHLPCLPSLRDLSIEMNCNLDLLSSIHKFPTLEQLQLGGNSELTCFPDRMLSNLTSLKTLSISGYSKLEEILPNEIANITSLKLLRISRCPGFNLLEGFQHLTNLESLTLSYLPNLESLPASLGNLSSLRSLYISWCPKLTCLPMSIQCLNCLEQLSIIGCKELGKRCEKEAGEDWPKIAHVQHIEIQT